MGLVDALGRPLPDSSARQDMYGSRASFRNPMTGIGTSRDKTTWGSYWAPWPLQFTELLAMYNGSDLASKIVEKRPKEMMRRGYEVRSRDLDDKAIQALDDKSAALRLNEILTEAMIWGRLFGGALVILGAEDGQEADQPLNEDKIKCFHFLNIVDRRFIWVQRYYSDPLSPNYGLPEIYLVSNSVAFGGSQVAQNPNRKSRLAATSIHESRVLRFDGAATDVLTRQQLAGWTWSVLQRVYDVLRRFDNAFDSVGNLLADASQAVYKLKGLADMIGSNAEQLVARMQLVDLSRSVARAVMVDADGEDFTRQPTTFAGIPDAVDRFMMRLAAAADMPVTEIFGRAPAGLNATGENDTRKWYDTIATEQENALAPKLKRLFRLIASAKDSGIKWKADAQFQIKFHPLWTPTDKEQADVELAVAQRDQIYLQEGVVTPEQVALSRYGSGKFSSFTDLGQDAIDALQQSLTGAVKYDPYENEPAPTGPLTSAAEQGQMQSPAVPLPLPGSPSITGQQAANKAQAPQRQRPKPPPGAPPKQGANKGDAKDAGPNVAKKVYKQLLRDYPAPSIAWVLSAQWTGPKDVSLDRIDFDGRADWKATRDGASVLEDWTDRIESGDQTPIILIDVPGKDKLQVADGHHRLLAYEKLGLPARAFVTTVQSADGPWRDLHSVVQGTSGASSR